MTATEGYVSDVPYTAGFYRETAPSHLAFAALAVGRSPGHALRPRRILELGFGQGFGLALLAAANPDIEFEGCDFNAEHVTHARRMIEDARLANIAVSQTDFAQAAQSGDNDVDVVIAHGVLSWVERSARDAVMAIVNRRLRPGGLLYVSYNCMPGWAPLAPIRQLIVEIKRHTADGSERQIARALEVLTALRQGNAAYLAANPVAARHIDAMLAMDRAYLAHEYLAEHSELLQFSDVAARLGEAGLSFVGSAALAENIEQCIVPPPLLPLMSGIDDPVLKESVRDFIANRQFRRDIFARGSATLSDAERQSMLSPVEFVLAVPPARVTFKVPVPLGELAGREDLYRPVVDLLARKSARFDELSRLPVFGEGGSGLLLECLALLVHSGQVFPVIAPAADVQPAQRFNRMVAEHARAGRLYQHLACPATRTGFPVTDFGLLTLAALLDGEPEQPAAIARYAHSILKRLGRRPLRQGVVIADDDEAEKFLEQHIGPIVADVVPVWRRLAVLS